MAKSLTALFQEADELISKKVAAASTGADCDDDVVKLAKDLLAEDVHTDETSLYSITEKLAHATALLDTLINFEELQKVAAFEQEALRSGHSSEQIAEFFEKRASVRLRSVTELIPGFRDYV